MSVARNSPSWAVDGRDWPNRAHSRFVLSNGLTWHVQEMGEGPVMLLLHGTGASTHSFRDLAPALAGHFHIVMADLPGHGFTQMPSSAGLSLKGMARLVAGLLKTLDLRPEIVVGHSAGAAILIAMTLDGMIEPKAIIAINGALRPIAGAHVFSPLAKLLFINPLVPKLFSWRAGDARSVRRLLEGTGSAIDPTGHRTLRPAVPQVGPCRRHARHDGELGSGLAAETASRARYAVDPDRGFARSCRAAIRRRPRRAPRAACQGRSVSRMAGISSTRSIHRRSPRSSVAWHGNSRSRRNRPPDGLSNFRD